MQTISLCRGVDLRIIEDARFKTNIISLFYHIPRERRTITMASLLPAVLKRGTAKYPTMQALTRRIADLYSANCSAGTRMKGDGEVLCFSMNYIADDFIEESLTEPVTEFLRELVYEPHLEDGVFSKEYVESEKINLKNAILGLINDKREYTDYKCREAMFGDEPYGMPDMGYAEDLETITPESLYKFYREVLDHAKVDVFVCGRADEAQIARIRKVLEPALSPREGACIPTEIAPPLNREPRTVVEEISVVQSKLSIGLRCNVEPLGKEYYALMLGSCIFGGSPFSKLFLNVREKLSLAYYAVCRTARLKSVMMISSGIETGNFQAAYDEIMLQLSEMKKGNISDGELSAAKKYMETSLHAMEDSMRSMEDYYLSQTIMGGEQSIGDLLRCLQRVTKEEIQAVMQKVTPDVVYFLKGTGEA